MDINLILGAGIPLTEMMALFFKISGEKEEFSYLKQFYDHMDLVAHIPVRNVSISKMRVSCFVLATRETDMIEKKSTSGNSDHVTRLFLILKYH